MSRRFLMLAAASIGGATLMGGLGVASASTVPVVVQPFAADSGDVCPMGFTKGTIAWQVGPANVGRVVDLKGIVADRPLPADPSGACGEDARFTTATFTAYARGSAVDSESQQADNGQRAFSASLTSAAGIDLLVVQVCRHSRLPGPPDTCGKPQVYHAPVSSA